MSSSIAITTGEPAGIGPEICVKAVFTGRVKSPVTLIGDKKLLIKTSEKLGFGSIFPDWVKFEHVPLAHPAVPGQLDVANAPYVVETLRRAAQGAQNGTYSAVVTAPVQKSIIIEAGIPFTGHTEFFQQFAGVDRVVMMLTSGTSQQALRVALVTTHLPLQQIPAAITDEALDKTLAICAHALHQDFGIERPRIAVTGLNPHAGESGHMGREEIERIAPAIERAKATVHSAEFSGPWPADTIFVPAHSKNFDCIVCMYHDQGLPALKREGFGHGINITLGLPWVRTSVDHGTALDTKEAFLPLFPSHTIWRNAARESASCSACSVNLQHDFQRTHLWPVKDFRDIAHANASGRTFCTIAIGSSASPKPSTPLKATTSSKSARGRQH